MHVAILSREFRDGEAVSEYSKHVANRLVEEGHKVSIVAFEDGSSYSVKDKVNVERVKLHFEADNIYNWAMMLNNEIKAGVMNTLEENKVDLIHANDWATAPGGITLSKHFEIPLVMTIHSTENQRGFEGEHAGMISELEWKAGFEADKVLAPNEDVGNSLKFDLDIPEEKVEVIDPYSPDWSGRIVEIYSSLMKEVLAA